MNRRRPWHHRLIRRMARHAPHEGIIPRSPLGLFFVSNIVGCLMALFLGCFAVALVFAAGGVACRLRSKTLAA